MTDSTFWLRAYVEVLTREVNGGADRTQALVEALTEVCPQFQEAYERHLAAAQKYRSEQEAEDVDMCLPLTSQPLSALHKKFQEESK